MWYSLTFARHGNSLPVLSNRWMILLVIVTGLFTTTYAPPVKQTKDLDPQTDLLITYLKEVAATPPEKRDEVHARWKEIMRKHAPVHSPGSIEQLKQTWHDDDEMDDDSYSMSSLFRTHDYNNDGFLSEEEIRALYYSELLRAYPDRNPTEDKVRNLMDIQMLENIRKRIDTDNDGNISFAEFMNYVPQHDEEFDWMDEDDLVDLEHAKSNKKLVDTVREELEKHPNDADAEKLMHELSGMPVIPEKKPMEAYSVHKASSDEATPKPAVKDSTATLTPSPSPTTKL